MLYIRHRINTVRDLRTVDASHGVELDLRDFGGELILQHDPFVGGESFTEYLKQYRHGLMILNIKSERIEWQILEEIERSGTVRDYFFLDCSFPMVHALGDRGMRKIALRFSEFEPVESVMALADAVEWVWVDCFTKNPLTPEIYARLKRAGLKICVVSPELQGHPVDAIAGHAKELAVTPPDAVCTKRPELWMQAQGNKTPS